MAMGRGSFARRAEGEEEPRVALVQGQHHLTTGTEEHQVSLPVAGGAAVCGTLRALGKRAAQRHERGRNRALLDMGSQTEENFDA